MTSEPVDLCTRWIETTDEALTLEDVQTVLAPIDDDLWVTAACCDRVLDAVDVQRGLLDEGLKRSESAKDRVHNIHLSAPAEGPASSASISSAEDTLVSYFKDEPGDAQILHLRALLLDRLDRLNTFVEVTHVLAETGTKVDAETEWEDDPWAEDEGGAVGEQDKIAERPPFPLSRFLVEDAYVLALLAASAASLPTLGVLLKRYPDELWSRRLTILDCIPEHIDTSECDDLLPSADGSTSPAQLEHARRDVAQWPVVRASLRASGSLPAQFDELGRISPPPHIDASPAFPDVSLWYAQRVDRILESTGIVDAALALVQHGAAKGVPGLDELGEELSLLSRMAYRTEEADEDEDISLSQWKEMTPSAVVRAYLKYSTPSSVVADIKKLVLPYLFVLEARAERSGSPDRTLAARLLNEYILTAPLDTVAAIFEASKPTLPAAQRLVRNDEELARLALACLYGNKSLSEWATMSRIFECLPAWDINDEDDHDEGDTTVASLGAFVTPTTSRPECTPQDLLLFFQPLPAASLSRVLDILDVHLESGEILSRWNVPVPLRWFLQSMNDHVSQRSRATRMSRRHGRSVDNLDSQEEWEWLLEDMLKLTGTNDAGVSSAFGALSRDEIVSIFFGGLLSTGRFSVAKNLLHSKRQPLELKDGTIENMCLAASREFYDNASSGNYHFGDMKLAYDCLSIPPPSTKVQEERDFIEATSRITSFKVLSRPGIPISPLEIRLTKDRLSLVSRVLSSTSDAYKHPEVILDLVHKLGLRADPVASVKALAMLADAAAQNGDTARAHDTAAQMVDALRRLAADKGPGPDPDVGAARDVCWLTCFQLGRHPDLGGASARRTLLGRALEFCPAESLPDVLAVWRRLESDEGDDDDEDSGSTRRRRSADERRRQHRGGSVRPKVVVGAGAGAGAGATSLAARFKGIASTMSSVPTSPDAASLAHTFSRVAATFPFSIGSSGSGGSGRPQSAASMRSEGSGREGLERERSSGVWTKTKLDHASEEVSAQASRALQKGIGWLIGADDE